MYDAAVQHQNSEMMIIEQNVGDKKKNGGRRTEAARYRMKQRK